MQSFMKKVLPLGLLMGMMLIIPMLVMADESGPDITPARELSWTPSAPGLNLASGLDLADSPIVAAGPGTTIAVGFNGLADEVTCSDDGDSDPYVSISTNGGSSFAAREKIYTPSGCRNSSFMDIAYSPDGTLHAVWVELEDGVDPIIRYAKRNGANNWTVSVVPTAAAGSFGAFVIDGLSVEADNTRVYLTWAQPDAAAFGDVRVFSSVLASGVWSTPKTVLAHGSPGVSDNPYRLPDTAAFNNKVYLVFQQNRTGLASDVVFVEGTPTANNITWSAPTIISDGLDGRDARIIVASADNSLHVSFNNYEAKADQSPQYVRCPAGNCQNSAGWEVGVVASDGNTAGKDAAYTVGDTTPFEVRTSIAHDDKNNAFVYFHGTQSLTGNETILGSNSCDEWYNTAMDEPSGGDKVNTNPALLWHADYLHLAYERSELGGDNTQVYFRRVPFGLCVKYVYLPLAPKE